MEGVCVFTPKASVSASLWCAMETRTVRKTDSTKCVLFLNTSHVTRQRLLPTLSSLDLGEWQTFALLVHPHRANSCACFRHGAKADPKWAQMFLFFMKSGASLKFKKMSPKLLYLKMTPSSYINQNVSIAQNHWCSSRFWFETNNPL